MPYTVAFISEVIRFSSVVPFGAHHRALDDKLFQGYFIPADTWILPNFCYMNQNPAIWGDPEIFRPERFLSEDRLKYVKNENFTPFSIGRRQCIGESLARDTIFLFLTNIVQRFEISFDETLPEPSAEPVPSMIFHPQPYTIVMRRRRS